jgi:hypothetical protein
MSVSFMDYLIDKNLFADFYRETESLKLIEAWLTDYHFHVSTTHIFMRQHADINVLAKIEKALTQFNASSLADLNLLYLYLGSYAFDQGDQSLALQYYSRLNIENFGNLLRYKISPGLSNNSSFRLMGKVFTFYLQNNKPAEAKHILDFFRNPVNRSSLYAAAARELSAENVNPSLTSELLDSALVEMNRLENLNTGQPNRFLITIALLRQSPTEQSIEKAKAIIKNQALKLTFQQRMARALAYRGELFKATEVIPGNISDTDQMEFLWNMVRGYAESTPTAPEWKEYEETFIWYIRTNFLPYVDETN